MKVRHENRLAYVCPWIVLWTMITMYVNNNMYVKQSWNKYWLIDWLLNILIAFPCPFFHFPFVTLWPHWFFHPRRHDWTPQGHSQHLWPFKKKQLTFGFELIVITVKHHGIPTNICKTPKVIWICTYLQGHVPEFLWNPNQKMLSYLVHWQN